MGHQTMTIDQYKKFVAEKEQFQNEIESFGERFYNIAAAISGFAVDKRCSYSGCSYEIDHINVHWTWSSYGRVDHERWVVPVSVFFDETQWESFVVAEIENEKKESAAAAEKRKQEEIAKAQETLKRYSGFDGGILS